MATRTCTSLLAMLLFGGSTVLWGQQNQTTPPSSSTPSSSSAPTASAPAKPAHSQTEKKQGQTGKSAPAPSSGPSAPSAPSAQGPSTKDANPFPERQSEAAATSKAPSSRPNPTAQDNPFPEAQSAEAAKRGNLDQGPPISHQPLPLLPPSGVSSSNANLSPKDLGEGTQRHVREDEYTKDKTPEGRIKNDLQVADFYMKNWNYRGAALRYKDALAFDPYNETALFGSAQAACMQNKTDQALAQFKVYLQQWPDGKHAKEAEKMLREPKKCADNR